MKPQRAKVGAALRALAVAWRKTRMYPRGSTIVEEAIDEAYRRCAALHSDTLRMRVQPSGILTDLPGDPGVPGEPDLARRLHDARIAELRLGNDLDRHGLSQLFEGLADDDGLVDFGSRLVRGAVSGLSARPLDLARIFDEHGAEVAPGQPLWDRLLTGFAAARDQQMEWTDVARDPELFRELVRWIGDPGASGVELTGLSRVDLFSMVAEQTATAIPDEPSSALETLRVGFRECFELLDPEAWLEFLSDPLPVAVGGGEDDRPIDLAALAARSFSAAQIERLIGYGMETRSHLTPRLYELFHRLAAGLPEGSGTQRRLVSLAPEVPSTATLEHLMHEETPAPWVTRDYGKLLMSRQRAQEVWNLSGVRRRSAELRPPAVAVATVRIGLSLLRREHEPGANLQSATFVAERLDPLLAQGELELLEECLAELRDQSEDPSRAEETRRELSRLLAVAAREENLRALLDRLDGGSAACFEQVWRILGHLDVEAVTLLFAELREHRSALLRHRLVRILDSDAPLPIADIEEGIRDPDARVARTFTLLAAEIGRTELLPSLRLALEQADAETRRAAVVGLGRIADPRAIDPLLAALTDDSLEVRVTAIRALRRRDPQGCSERIAAALALSNWSGRNNRVLVAALKAAEALRERTLLPLVERLARPPLLFRRRRRPVTMTAQRVAMAMRAAAESRPATAVATRRVA